MAGRHYQGNVSLCLRASIESHREALQGEGQFAANQVARQLESLDQGQSRLESLVDELAASGDEDSSPSRQLIVEGIKMDNETAGIYEVLAESDTLLRIEDIVEQTGACMEALQQGLTRLVELGLIYRTEDRGQRYGLTGNIGYRTSEADSE